MAYILRREKSGIDIDINGEKSHVDGYGVYADIMASWKVVFRISQKNRIKVSDNVISRVGLRIANMIMANNNTEIVLSEEDVVSMIKEENEPENEERLAE